MFQNSLLPLFQKAFLNESVNRLGDHITITDHNMMYPTVFHANQKPDGQQTNITTRQTTETQIRNGAVFTTFYLAVNTCIM